MSSVRIFPPKKMMFLNPVFRCVIKSSYFVRSSRLFFGPGDSVLNPSRTNSTSVPSPSVETPSLESKGTTLNGKLYQADEWTNITPKMISYLDQRLHLRNDHPLGLIRARIVDFMYARYRNHRGNPLFSVHDNLNPVVTIHQNYDSLLVPQDHPSRKKTDAYYFNKDNMLRAHTSAHQAELISMGLDNFLVIGDVYRRDAIDSSHFPVFHQVEGVRLFNEHNFAEIVIGKESEGSRSFQVFEDGKRNPAKQATHSLDSARMMEIDLKNCLLSLTKDLFGQDIEYRWVDCYFPFTHPSWELEIMYQGDWMEVLGCGIVEQQILNDAGAHNKLGWAFGLGLERLAMRLYQIPDIRLFWSRDSGFFAQFKNKSPKDKIIFKSVSKYPQCSNDISFWIPEEDCYSENDFYDLVRSVGGDIIEQVTLIDSFTHPKTHKLSHCYRLIYRHMERTLTQEEVNSIHKQIEVAACNQLKVTIR